MKKLNILLESYLNKSESIDPKILESMVHQSHYNAKNHIYPSVIGREGFLLSNAQKKFNQAANKVKRVFNVDNINPSTYFDIKKQVKGILSDINEIESKNKPDLNKLTEKIIRESFEVPEDLLFDFDNEYVDDFDGENIIEQFKKTQPKYDSNDYFDIEASNKKIDRCRMNHCKICGAANNSVSLFKKYEDDLDSINHKLYPLYNKLSAFNKFNIWVTPDDILTQETSKPNELKIFDQGNNYVISVDAQNLPWRLFEITKGVFSILFQEKYNNPYVDYNSPWNVRIGSIVWDKLNKCIKNKRNKPLIYSSFNDLDDKDYSYVMSEILNETPYSKQMINELELSLEKY